MCRFQSCDHGFCRASNVLAFYVGGVRVMGVFRPIESNSKQVPVKEHSIDQQVYRQDFGTSNEREIKRIVPLMERVNVLEPETKQLSDEQLRAKTDEFRQRIRERLDAVEDPDEKERELK